MSNTVKVEGIRETRLADALSERYLSYALSTIMARSLPDVRDGLKPVHRRLLYAMRQLKLDPTAGFKKCARVVGDVMGKYHPHGDQAIYDAMVRLAQDFAVRYPLVEGQGNFGNIDGDNAAAMRYTEARMTAVAWALLEGIDRDAVDYRDTYDGEDNEPIILPARFPNLLANGATGIAVGMATSIPPHNAGEICNALLHLIKHPRVTFEKLAEIIPGPDFPTGGVLVEDRKTIIGAYKVGRGTFRLRARWERENLSNGHYHIIIQEIPFQVQKSRLIEKVAEMMLARKLPMLADIRDESTDTVRVILEPKNRTIDPVLLMEHLFKFTDLESRISLNMNVLSADNVPCVMNLREVLQAFLDHRHVVLIRETKHQLEKIEHRLEVLGGLLVAYLNLDEVIRIIRETDEAKSKLTEVLAVTDIQAEAILNMRLRQLRKLEEREIRRENSELTANSKKLRNLLKDEKQRWTLIGREISDIRESFGQKTELGRRRTTIKESPKTLVMPLNVMIEREPVTVIYSEKGWIRAARGHLDDARNIKFKDGDRLKFLLHAETIDKLILFATNGRFYTVGAEKLPGGRGHGEPVRLMIDLPNGEDIIDMFIFRGGRDFLISSDSGRGFAVSEDKLVAQTKNGKQVLNLKPGQEAKAIKEIGVNHDHVAVIGTNRRLLLFPLNELPKIGRGAGVIMQRYSKGGLADLTTLNVKEGLTWKTGAGTRLETDINSWVGKRGQAGSPPFKGFPRSNVFR
ncbi:MAG: DNA topoisomerase IV subunit A [Rhodospirillaceae bacterium TMED8]|nr:DNA topoisomerase IV subunit A [Magnetovibrio sp.]OUT51634.1 MAG: DNA topoisomerase IV subunit A [Rhodospirillaceae bacterium TMED8]